VIADCTYHDGKPVEISSRGVLRRVLKLYEARGWRPVVAPELEFFLTKVNEDPDYPLVPPIGRSRRQETARQSFGIDAVNEFDPIFEDVYDWCEAQEIDIDTLSHEAGRRRWRSTSTTATRSSSPTKPSCSSARSAKPPQARHLRDLHGQAHGGRAGSSMHIHLSLYDVEGGQNLFAAPDGAGHTPLFLNFIGGLQEYLPAAMPFMAPNVNSYRRLRRHSTAPINVHWGLENRTVGLRVPASRPEARRVENRLAVPTPTPTSRSRPRSPAAGSASPAGSSPPTRSRAAPTAWPRPCRSRCPRRCAS
jgi:glutamine synthetase